MTTFNGFDRLSTEEELHQVLTILNQFSRSGWVVPAEDMAEWQETALCADAVEEDDSAESEALAQLITTTPEALKN